MALAVNGGKRHLFCVKFLYTYISNTYSLISSFSRVYFNIPMCLSMCASLHLHMYIALICSGIGLIVDCNG